MAKQEQEEARAKHEQARETARLASGKVVVKLIKWLAHTRARNSWPTAWSNALEVRTVLTLLHSIQFAFKTSMEGVLRVKHSW